MERYELVYIARDVYDGIVAEETHIPLRGVSDEHDRVYYLEGSDCLTEAEARLLPDDICVVNVRGGYPDTKVIEALVEALESALEPSNMRFVTLYRGMLRQWDVVSKPFAPYAETLFWTIGQNGQATARG